MKRACVICLAALLPAGAFAQNVTRSFGSVVFPGGTAGTTPGVSRNFGSVVFPGGSPTTPPVRTGPPPAFNFNSGNSFNRGNFFNGGNFRRGDAGRGGAGRGYRDAPAAVFGYPLYMPGYFDAPASSDTIAPLAPPDPQQPNVTVIYPQQQPQDVRPIVIQIAPDGSVKRENVDAAPQVYQPAEAPAPSTASATDQQSYYLLAFKDHTIYSAVAYWFDGDTLHYFTKGDTHNQVSVSLIDRDLTERLNREMGIEFKMPPAK